MKNNLELTPELKKMLEDAPEFGEEALPFKDGVVIARGFAQFKENINRNGRPKVEDPKVSISVRIPLSYANELRATGQGWQTRISEYVTQGIRQGAFGKKEA